MNKSELIKKVAERNHITKDSVSKVINCFFEELSEGLKSDTEVSIKDFGTFRKVIQKEKKARNPQTGELITVPEKEIVKFKPSKNVLNIKWL